MVKELDLKLGDGRILHVYDTRADDGGRLPVLWHHGTPNIGSPPAPLFPAAERLGLRWVSYDRPGYGGSTPDPGRDLGSAADLASIVADALGIDRFAVMGHSGGGSHALACGALLPDRVLGVVSIAGLAPFDAGGLDWFAGMAASGVDSLRAAAVGRAEKQRYEASGAEYDPEFTASRRGGTSGRLVVAARCRPPGAGAGPRRVDRRRPCVRRAMGRRGRADHGADPRPARRSRSRRAERARGVARRPMPRSRASSVSRRGAHLDPRLQRVCSRVAPRESRLIGGTT